MDLRIRSNRDFVTQLAYANSVIEICRTSIVRMDFDDSENVFSLIQIDRMIMNLETMKKYLENEATHWRHLQAVNRNDD